MKELIICKTTKKNILSLSAFRCSKSNLNNLNKWKFSLKKLSLLQVIRPMDIRTTNSLIRKLRSIHLTNVRKEIAPINQVQLLNNLLNKDSRITKSLRLKPTLLQLQGQNIRPQLKMSSKRNNKIQ